MEVIVKALVWFITGASSEFGLEIARAALQRGDAAVAAARKPQDGERALGRQERLLAVALDVTNEQQAQAAVNPALQLFGQIDILVNNAGRGLLGAVEEASADEIRSVFAVNADGLMSVTRAVLPSMCKRRSGRHSDHQFRRWIHCVGGVGSVLRHEVRGGGTQRSITGRVASSWDPSDRH